MCNLLFSSFDIAKVINNLNKQNVFLVLFKLQRLR